MTNPDAAASDLHLVPETLLKKRHDLDALRAQRAASALSHTNSRKRSVANQGKNGGGIKIVKPETILAQSRQRKNSSIRYNRVAKKGMQKRASNKSVVKVKVWDSVREEVVEEKDLPGKREKEAKEEEEEVDEEREEMEEEGDDDEDDAEEALKKKKDAKDAVDDKQHLHEVPYRANSVGATSVFAVLLRPANRGASQQVRRTLSSLRLRFVNEGVFLPYTPITRKMLHLVEPYVLYGVVGAETASDLVRRRGFCRVKEEKKRAPLSDNNIVERELGELGLICVEDLVQVLVDGANGEGGEDGEQLFGKVSKFLWPFRLSSRRSKFQMRMLDLKDGKLYGDRGEAMDAFVREML